MQEQIFGRNCCMEKTHIGGVMKDRVLWQELDAEAGEGCEKEGVAEKKHYEPTAVPFSAPLGCMIWGK